MSSSLACQARPLAGVRSWSGDLRGLGVLRRQADGFWEYLLAVVQGLFLAGLHGL